MLAELEQEGEVRLPIARRQKEATMADIDVVVQTADKTRKEALTVDESQTCGEVVLAAIENWALPADGQYTIAEVSGPQPRQLNSNATLVSAGVKTGATLAIQNMLVAG